MFRNKKGQSTVEYILLVTAVIAVLIFFMTSKDRGMQAHLGKTMNTATDKMAVKSTTLTGSQKDASNAPSPTGTPIFEVKVDGKLLK